MPLPQTSPSAAPVVVGMLPMRLAASLDMAAAEELLLLVRDVMRAADPGGAAVLDGSAVERVSVPCLQVLAAAARGGRTGLRIIAASAVLAAAIDDLGLAATIPLEH